MIKQRLSEINVEAWVKKLEEKDIEDGEIG